MRIWYLSGSVVPSTAANSVHVMKMAHAFAHHGHEVSLYAWRGDDGSVDPFQVYGVDRSFRLRRVWRLSVRGAGRVQLPGMILADSLPRHRRPDLLYGRSLFTLASRALPRAPRVWEPHNPPADAREARAVARLIARPDFLGLVVISEALRLEYERRYPTLRNRILVAPDGADPGGGPPPASGRTTEPRPLRVGYVGQLYRGKGVETIIRLAAALPEVEFHVVGGAAEDIAYWKAEMAGLQAGCVNLRFHGHVAHADLPAHFARFDVCVAPYGREVSGAGGGRDLSRWMSPLKIFEYMAAGKPIVCSDLSVLREVLRDELDALLVPPEDLASWIGALRRLESDPELRERLARTAFDRFHNRYTWKRRAERIVEFVRERMDRVSAPSSAEPRGALPEDRA